MKQTLMDIVVELEVEVDRDVYLAHLTNSYSQ